MDLPRVPWQEYVSQRWSGLSPELKQAFTSLQDIDDVFKCVLNQINHDDLSYLQAVANGYPVEKDGERAASCREHGNCSFQSRDYISATFHYSQGVCFAPQSSEQLSFCYANRSASLYRLQRYQESLDDIASSLKHGYPSRLKHKLEERQKQCLHHLSAGLRGTEDFKSLPKHNKESESEHIPLAAGSIAYISPRVYVSFQPEKGRHLLVTEAIAAGEVILVDRPYSCVLVPGTEELKGKPGKKATEKGVSFGTEQRRCHRCLCETMRPVPCVGCSYSRYCSDGCRRQAWEEHHCWECPIGADLRVTGVMSQLALRVALKAGWENVQRAREPITNEENSKESLGDSRASLPVSDWESAPAEVCGDSYRSVYHLLHHAGRQSPELRFLCAVTIATLYLKLRRSAPPPAPWDHTEFTSVNSPVEGGERPGWSPEHWLLGSVVLRHMLQLRCNAQAVGVLQDTGVTDAVVQSTQEVCIATALFPTLSLLNHSCSPNTSLGFRVGDGGGGPGCSAPPRGVSLAVRAANDITAGQEVLHCYGPHSSRMATKERQRLLQDQYYFRCRCEACSQPGLVPDSSREDFQLLCGKCQNPLKKCTAGRTGFICGQPSCNQWICSSEVRHGLQEVRDQLEKAVGLMESDRPDEALILLKRTSSRAGRMLCETHPLRGELADAAARAYASQGEWRRAASQLRRSTVAVSAQYGQHSMEMGRQLFKLAQLHFNGGDPEETLAVLPRARRLLHLHCGPQCPELLQLQAMEECLTG